MRRANNDFVEWVEEGMGEEEDTDRLALGLIGRLWTTRVPNPSEFIFTMQSLWMLKHGFDISNIGHNLY